MKLIRSRMFIASPPRMRTFRCRAAEAGDQSPIEYVEVPRYYPDMRTLLFAAVLLLAQAAPTQRQPVVRIGLQHDASTVSLRSARPFTVQQRPTSSATFTAVVTVPAASSEGTLQKADLQYRMVVELDQGQLLVLPMGTHVRVEPADATIEIDKRTYRGVLEVFGNARNTFTVVNELPVEDYLLGVVPNELNPTIFGHPEALKAQAVAARTYVRRNMGQFKKDGYDICATDACQVYLGAGTEEALATRAVLDTRGVIATFDGKPINALYVSTCGGRTEDAENIFNEKVPYLVSTTCEYKHPEPRPFTSGRSFPDWRDAVLSVAGVSTFADASRFMGLAGQGEPPAGDASAVATFIRQSFYPTVRTTSDLSFLTEQGILSPRGELPAKEILFRLVDRKGAFEWQQGVLLSWDGTTIKLLVNGEVNTFTLKPEAPIYQRIGDERVAMRQGSWIGGELMDFRAVGDEIQMIVYRINFANPAADRYSRVALWQTHRTRQELEAAFRPLNIGRFTGMRVIQRGQSERPTLTEIEGSTARRTVRALHLRTLLGLRDSLFSFDIERNATGELIGMTFYGRGWGHGVGMCQVGAYGMAMEGATYEEILKKYYKGIELTKLY
jgi:stage II sporulation protein D